MGVSPGYGNCWAAEGQLAVHGGFWAGCVDCCAGDVRTAKAVRRATVESDRTVVRATIVDSLPGCCWRFDGSGGEFVIVCSDGVRWDCPLDGLAVRVILCVLPLQNLPVEFVSL